MKKKLRIAINAQIPSGSGTGGIETVLRTLTSLNQLDGDEEYVFIGHQSDADWLKPLLGERQTLVCAPQPEQNKPNQTETLKRVLGTLRPLARVVKRFVVPPRKAQVSVPTSDGFYENLNCDVIHFPYQDYVYCRVPTVYNPHDLQHLHYPEFFAPEEIQRREIVYPAACRAAHTVVVASQFIKQDVMQKYGTKAEKIQVIPWSPPETALDEFTEQDADALFEKYECPPRPFILYPAMTWEHKNHIRLLEAVALLRERERLKINVVCTGHKNSFYPRIERRLHELKHEEQVKFTGIVEYKELSIFYRRAQFVIVPTLFEAASAPLFEAWQHGVAVACSSVTSLPKQAAGAALLFNPFSVEEIAAAVKTMASDETLRAEFRARGFRRLQNFDMERTLKAYRAVYRKTAGIGLSDEDRHLLNRDWTRDS
ncbi:MAG: glycosyltransferase family 4 protein [Acidobacteriota bacterium]|nr:glycosyltransferase family 4 protein [Acidobacteriota bacterium]